MWKINVLVRRAEVVQNSQWPYNLIAVLSKYYLVTAIWLRALDDLSAWKETMHIPIRSVLYDTVPHI